MAAQPMEVKMSTREHDIRKARRMITDSQLTEFLRAIQNESSVFAVELINDHLDKGESLDSIFYTGDGGGFLLSVERGVNSSFKISFGCEAGPLCGDGGEWQVKFDVRGQVVSVEGSIVWVS